MVLNKAFIEVLKYGYYLASAGDIENQIYAMNHDYSHSYTI